MKGDFYLGLCIVIVIFCHAMYFDFQLENIDT